MIREERLETILNKYISDTRNIFDRYKILYLFSYIHIIFIGGFNIFFPLYSYIFNYQGVLNYFYLFFVILIFLHWLILKNECIISLFVKKLINNDYKIGNLGISTPDLQYNVFLNKWDTFKTYNRNNFLKTKIMFLVNMILYISVTLKINTSVKNKVLYLFVFMIIFVMYIKEFDNYSDKICHQFNII